ncbi:glycosyltransferase family 4 protein [Seonamhaeicola algicola]|uniref:Glycosyltransferase family 4 protein n=1 Tax=Seonamhaeicola algicola TaxID=1719036 RepID=A0A5C7AVD3_9FLAO|nr:glycosyltransferase family 4 protein [Seonamhaeicola algicola]TXE12034.1 glycosyltransferase family 4 protein [Seonamhaeicola algicola]
MSKEIVVVVDSIDVNDSSGSKANVALIKNLAAIGYRVTVCHYTQKNISLKDVNCIAIKENRFSLLFVLSRTQRIIQRYLKINLAQYLEPIFGFSFTFFNDTKSISQFLKKLKLKSDLVLTLSKAASFRPHYAVNKIPELHNKWLAYIHDPYPFSCYPQPYRFKEPGYKVKEVFFKKVTENAEHVVFPSLLLKEWMGQFFNNCNKKGVIIPHQQFELSTEKIKLPNFLDINKFNLLHAGGLLNARNPEGLLKGLLLFFQKFPEHRDEVQLILIGNTTRFSNMLSAYHKEMPELVVVDKTLPFNDVYAIQMMVSVNIILETISNISPFLPGKFPHCVSANKKMMSLSPLKSEVRRLLGADYPYVAEIDDVTKIANIIEELYFLWKKNSDNLLLNREDLNYYLSGKYLKEVIDNLNK